MFGVATTRGRRERRLSNWTRNYLPDVALADLGCAAVGVFMAAQIRFGRNVTPTDLALSLGLPVLWIAALRLAGAYDVRFIGTGSDEYRRVLNAGVSLTAAVAIFSYAINLEFSCGYVVIALPGITLFDMAARLVLRKRLRRHRAAGKCAHNLVAVGHEAVTACPEMNGVRLRSLAWDLEKTGTDLCISPALLDVAGPRTTIRPTAGLSLLHVDQPRLAGFRLLLKGLFDRCAAAAALVMLAPVMATLPASVSSFTAAWERSDRRPARRPSTWAEGCLHPAALIGPAAIRLRRQAGRQGPMKRKGW